MYSMKMNPKWVLFDCCCKNAVWDGCRSVCYKWMEWSPCKVKYRAGCTANNLISNSLLGNLLSLSGFEISDVLKIDDKDYAITFSLYFRWVFHIMEFQNFTPHIYNGERFFKCPMVHIEWSKFVACLRIEIIVISYCLCIYILLFQFKGNQCKRLKY